MRVTFDTNVLLRLIVADDPGQVAAATKLLDEAELIAVPLVTLCEAVWTLRRHYKRTTGEIADALGAILSDERVRADFALVEAGLTQLRGGGDFADAVIAGDGRRQGSDMLATFDKDAARLLESCGGAVLLLA